MTLATLMLAATLLTCQQPQADPQKGWVIEIRGYTHHLQALPKDRMPKPVLPREMQPGQPTPKIDVIEGFYVDDLPAFFEKMKKEKP